MSVADADSNVRDCRDVVRMVATRVKPARRPLIWGWPIETSEDAKRGADVLWRQVTVGRDHVVA
jgi:3-polyprenyl-4-hydroxybenzoate decarboxylase